MDQESESSDEDSSNEQRDLSVREEAARDIDECGARLIALETEVKKNDLTPKNVAKLFKQGKIKYAMYNSITTTERLQSLIKNNKISANSRENNLSPPHRVQKKKKCSNEITGSNTTKKT